ncbi:MAG: CHAT domain-containing tetratricopeptide repeat protein, partial [Microcoleaceae cyanobacterium]
PMDWAMTQNNLGIAYSDRITGDKAENIESAIAAYQNALQVRTQKDFPMDWAMTQNNLGIAYSDRITGDKAQNIESAIAAYQNALQVLTLEANPLYHLKTTRNLGNLYFDNQNWQLATENYEKAITAVEVSRSWATTDDRRQEIIKENIGTYSKAILAYIYIDRLDKALEIAERSQARNLVELLTNRDLLPKVDVDPEITEQFQQLKQKIRVGEGELQKVRQQLSGQDVQQQSSLAESEKHLNEELEELEQQLEKVFNEIQKFDPTFRLTQEVQPMTFAEIEQLATEEQTAFIEWYITAEKFLAFVILPPTPTANSELFVWQSTEEDLENLEEWVIEYLSKYDERKEAYYQREENSDKSENLQQEWEANITTRLEKLGEILHINEIIQPILERQCQKLTLIPDFFLHLLPLHALPVAIPNPPKSPLERGTFEAPPLERGTLNVSNPPKSPLERGTLETSSLKTGTLEAPPLQKGAGREFTPHKLNDCYINPENSQENPEKIYLQDYFPQGISYAPSCQILQKVRMRECQDFQSLFAIQTPTPDLYEQDLSVVSAIKQQFDEAEILKKTKATKSAVINHPKLSVANSILFFCHGYFNFNSPLDSGLELADGMLTLADIIQYLNLKNCRLVTLAACETGLTDFKHQEYVGLPSGFLLAGSTNIVASLWSVRSDATALLMLRLYQELEKFDNIVVALKKAQNWLRNTGVQELREWVRQSPLISVFQVKLEKDFMQMENQRGGNFKPYHSPYFWAGFCIIGKGE